MPCRSAPAWRTCAALDGRACLLNRQSAGRLRASKPRPPLNLMQRHRQDDDRSSGGGLKGQVLEVKRQGSEEGHRGDEKLPDGVLRQACAPEARAEKPEGEEPAED